MLYAGSRYLSTVPYLTNKGSVSLTRRRRRKFNTADCEVYTFTQGDTLDGISSRFYGNSVYWWVFLDANPQYQSELDIKPGDSILIPNYEEVVVSSNE